MLRLTKIIYNMLSDLDRSVCGAGATCCSGDVQIILGGLGKQELVSQHNKTLGDLATLLNSRALKFDGKY